MRFSSKREKNKRIACSIFEKYAKLMHFRNFPNIFFENFLKILINFVCRPNAKNNAWFVKLIGKHAEIMNY